MSPTHGYLHEPVAYPALCYDLMEPYGYLIEEAVVAAYIKLDDSPEKRLTAEMFIKLKEKLSEVTFVPLTRQRVMRKVFLHGVVLALRSYLVGETSRFLVPSEGERHAGRPRKVAFRLPVQRVD